MFEINENQVTGRWVLVENRNPESASLHITLTKNGVFGIASYVDDEWIQFLPTYLGDVYKWYEFVNDRGEPVEFSIEPEPELQNGA